MRSRSLSKFAIRESLVKESLAALLVMKKAPARDVSTETIATFQQKLCVLTSHVSDLEEEDTAERIFITSVVMSLFEKSCAAFAACSSEGQESKEPADANISAKDMLKILALLQHLAPLMHK